jgi:hypothetical protein
MNLGTQDNTAGAACLRVKISNPDLSNITLPQRSVMSVLISVSIVSRYSKLTVTQTQQIPIMEITIAAAL